MMKPIILEEYCGPINDINIEYNKTNNFNHSFLNENIEINEKYSAVTIICSLKKKIHAELIIEKMYNNKIHIYKLSFNNGSNKYYWNILIDEFIDTNDIFISRQSETWQVSSDKVETMINLVKNERDNPLGYPNAFCIFGNKSIFSKTMEKIQIKNKKLQKLYTEYPNFYKNLIMIYNKCIAKNNNDVNIFYNICFVPDNKGGFFIDAKSIDTQERLNIINLRIEKILNNNITNYKFLEKLVVKYNGDYLIIFKMLLVMVNANSKIIKIKGNNCFTWIREKLKILDIHMIEKKMDKIIANPWSYTKKKYLYKNI